MKQKVLLRDLEPTLVVLVGTFGAVWKNIGFKADSYGHGNLCCVMFN